MSKKMDEETYFAPAQRAGEAELRREIDFVAGSPVMSVLLRTANGLLAVLNADRQVIAVNDAFLKELGIGDPRSVFGLRPGEVIQCVHADDMPGGCGTSRFCGTCGAAVAIVASLAGKEPVERVCVATVRREGRESDLCLSVRSCRLLMGDNVFVLLFLQDITVPQRWAEVERIFFHDVSNILTALHGAAVLLPAAREDEMRELSREIADLSLRLAKEVEVQKLLLQENAQDYRIVPQDVSTKSILTDLRSFFANHPVARNKTLTISNKAPAILLNTDVSLVLRILTNMLTNAFEATEQKGEVRLWVDAEKGAVTFNVWNAAAIPDDVSLRVFQRHFTTKEEAGRGLGTYAMKFFGERLLSGKIDFTTSEADGTIFRLCLPV